MIDIEYVVMITFSYTDTFLRRSYLNPYLEVLNYLRGKILERDNDFFWTSKKKKCYANGYKKVELGIVGKYGCN